MPMYEGEDIFQWSEMAMEVRRALVKTFKVTFAIVFCSVGDWMRGSSPFLQDLGRMAWE